MDSILSQIGTSVGEEIKNLHDSIQDCTCAGTYADFLEGFQGDQTEENFNAITTTYQNINTNWSEL